KGKSFILKYICHGINCDDLYFIHIFSLAPISLQTTKVIVGDLNFNITTESQEEQVQVETVVFHSHFDPYYLENDIALIKLKTPIKFRPAVQPICLPE